MTVGGLTLDPVTKTPIVVLRDEADNLNLPIWIGLLEATAMATELEGVKMARPMTHDLLRNLISECGAQVQAIEVTELRENTFFAAIQLTINGQSVTIDARPSDAISLALRTKSPIYVARAVLEASSVLSSEQEDAADGTPDGKDMSNDLSRMSPEEWEQVLEKLDPDDFKYKM